MARPKNPANTLHRTCPTCGKEFTCEKRKPKTYCCKRCAANSLEVKEKNRKGVEVTFKEKYGGHPMAVNEQTKENFKSSMLEKHGVAFAAQMEDFEQKVKATKLKKHGDENYNNVEQMKATCLKLYGVDNYRKTKEYAEKVKQTCMKKYGVPHASMLPTRRDQINSSTFKHSHKLAMFKKFVTSEKFQSFEPMFNLDEYDGVTVRYNRPYKFKCKRCGEIHEHDLTRQYLRCPTCDSNMSIFQTEVIEYIKQLLPGEPIVVNNRTILSPLEIDIFVPNKNIAIETNGLYWHSEISGSKDKNYHLNKTKMTVAKGIRLLHVMEHEWNQRREAVKLVLRNILTPTATTTTNAVVREISPEEKKAFLEKYHLDGNDVAMVRLGLFSGETLSGVMTFTKTKIHKESQWEISRFCSTIGGADVLFEHFQQQHAPTSVIAQCDRRYFSGETYMKLGFMFIRHSPPTYHYIIDAYKTTEPNFKWTKAKLKNKLVEYNKAFSEWENMKMNGFDRIWDCGHSKWLWTRK